METVASAASSMFHIIAKLTLSVKQLYVSYISAHNLLTYTCKVMRAFVLNWPASASHGERQKSTLR